MKITLAAVTTIAGLVACSSAEAAVTKWKATLNGAQEVPAVNTTATGTAEFDFDDTAKTLSGVIELTGVDVAKVNGQHIHKAACGASGSFVKVLTKPGENGVIALDASDPWKMSDSDVSALQAGELYVNVHTEANPGGEIRGQIFKDGATDVCPKGGAGGDGGPTTVPTDGGGNTSSSGGTGDGGTTSSSSSDDGGCSTSGSSNGSNGLLVALGVGLTVGAISRRCPRAKKAKQR